MTRSICKWIAVVSWVGMGLAGGLMLLAMVIESGDWSFTSFFSSSPSSLSMKIFEVTNFLQMALMPLCALSTAAYIFLIDRAVRDSPSRGFDVQMK